MKKIVSLVLIAVLALSITSCGGAGGKTSNGPSETAYAVGDKIATNHRAQYDKKLHKISFRITKINKNQDNVNKIIKKYNTSGMANSIGDLTSDKVEYVVVDYEVKYPENFPKKEYGITNPELSFKITNMHGGKIIEYNDKNYEGLQNTWEIGDEPMGYDFYPGDTYKGRIVFLMVKNCKDYLIMEYYKDGENIMKHFIKP